MLFVYANEVICKYYIYSMSIPIRRDCSYEPLPEMSSVEGLHTQVDCEETPQQSGLHTYAPESGQGK